MEISGIERMTFEIRKTKAYIVGVLHTIRISRRDFPDTFAKLGHFVR
jgi:hypothetical protein